MEWDHENRELTSPLAAGLYWQRLPTKDGRTARCTRSTLIPVTTPLHNRRADPNGAAVIWGCTGRSRKGGAPDP